MTGQEPQNYNHTDPSAFPDEDWRKYRRRAYLWGVGILTVVIGSLFLGYQSGTEETISNGYRVAIGLLPFGGIMVYLHYRSYKIRRYGKLVVVKVNKSNDRIVSLFGQRMTFLTVEFSFQGKTVLVESSMKSVKPAVIKGDVIVGSYNQNMNLFSPSTTQFKK